MPERLRRGAEATGVPEKVSEGRGCEGDMPGREDVSSRVPAGGLGRGQREDPARAGRLQREPGIFRIQSTLYSRTLYENTSTRFQSASAVDQETIVESREWKSEHVKYRLQGRLQQQWLKYAAIVNLR